MTTNLLTLMDDFSTDTKSNEDLRWPRSIRCGGTKGNADDWAASTSSRCTIPTSPVVLAT